MNLICLVEVAVTPPFTCLTQTPLISLFSVSAFGRDVLVVCHPQPTLSNRLVMLSLTSINHQFLSTCCYLMQLYICLFLAKQLADKKLLAFFFSRCL